MSSAVYFSLDLVKPLVAVTVLAFTVCLSAGACAQEVQSKPSKVWAVIENFGAHTYRVEFRDGSLHYEDAMGATTESAKITPTAGQWLQFRKALDAIAVWDWKSSYVPDEAVFDGTTWSFSIRYSDRGVFTSGENCYPEVDARPCTADVKTPSFMRLESAIEALLGGKPFRSAAPVATK